MHIFRNEKGGVLLYVLMISAVLMVMIPVMLTMTSTNDLTKHRNHAEKLTHSIAVSGMESFLAYLNSYTGADKVAHFNNYQGWGFKTFTMPDGQVIQYQQSVVEQGTTTPVALPISAETRYDVIVEAVSGDVNDDFAKNTNEPFFTLKRVKYSMNVTNTSGGGFNPDSPEPVADTPENNIFAPSETQTGVPESDITTYEDIGEAIAELVSDFATNIDNQINNYEASVTSCGTACTCPNCGISALMTKLNDNPNIPAIVKANSLTINSNTTLGSPSKPVVVIVDSLIVGSSVTVYGDLIVKGSLSTSNNFDVIVKQVNSSYGNLWIQGSTNASNNGLIQVEGTFNTSSMNVENNANIDAQSIVIEGSLSVSNNAVLHTDPQNLIIGGSVELENNSIINSSGDMIVGGSITADNANITTGGYIAVGEGIDFNANTEYETGGGTSIITLIPNPGGTTTPPADTGWDVSRTNSY